MHPPSDPSTSDPSTPPDQDAAAFDRAEKAIRDAQAAIDRASVSTPEIPANLKPAASSPTLRKGTTGPTGATTTSSMSVAYGLAFELGVYLIVCTVAGWLVDTYLVGGGSRTWTIFGACFGLVGGMIRTIRGARAMYRAMDGPAKPTTKPTPKAPTTTPPGGRQRPGPR